MFEEKKSEKKAASLSARELSSSELHLVEEEVKHILLRLPYPILNEDDLRGYAYLGLLDARKRFKPSQGTSFQVYARYRIRGTIFDGIRKSSYFGRSGYQALKTWLHVEELTPKKVHLEKIQHQVNSLSSTSPHSTSHQPEHDLNQISPQQGQMLFSHLRQLATHLCIESALTPTYSSLEIEVEQERKETQRTLLSQAFEELPSKDQELVIALYDLKRCGDDATQYAERINRHRSSVYRRHARILERLRQRVRELSDLKIENS